MQVEWEPVNIQKVRALRSIQGRLRFSSMRFSLQAYSQKLRLLGFTFVAVWLLTSGASVVGQPLQPGERLTYTVSYQGILTGWTQSDIAKAILEIDPQAYRINGESLLSAHLFVSTEQYKMAEQIYPLRYSFRSWFEPTGRYSLLIDETNKEQETTQQLVWFDRDKQLVRRYKRSDDQKHASEVLPEFLQVQYATEGGEPSGFRSRGSTSLQYGMLDHLSLLYRLRLMALQPGKVVDLPASDGKDLIGYRVEMLGEERLHRADESRMTMKMKFQPRYRDEDDLSAIYVWYTLDEGHIPIRFYSGRTFGNIEVNLDGGQPGLRWEGERAPEPPPTSNILDDDW